MCRLVIAFKKIHSFFTASDKKRLETKSVKKRLSDFNNVIAVNNIHARRTTCLMVIRRYDVKAFIQRKIILLRINAHGDAILGRYLANAIEKMPRYDSFIIIRNDYGSQ